MVDLTEYYAELKQAVERDPSKTVPLLEDTCEALEKLLSDNPESKSERASLLGRALSQLLEIYVHEGISPLGSLLLDRNLYGKGSSLLSV